MVHFADGGSWIADRGWWMVDLGSWIVDQFTHVGSYSTLRDFLYNMIEHVQIEDRYVMRKNQTLFVCLFDCLFVCLTVCLTVCLIVCLTWQRPVQRPRGGITELWYTN